MTLLVAEDRSMCVQPFQVVQTAWVDIDLCKLGCWGRLSWRSTGTGRHNPAYGKFKPGT
jgi:hypothetical protein